MGGTAVSGTDYILSGVSGQAVIAAGAHSAVVTLSALPNHSLTGNRVATMALQSGNGYSVSPSNVVSLTITGAAPSPSSTLTSPPVPIPTAVPSPTPLPRPTPARQVWISARTDGLPGSGTQNDPYDGSTQAKFDAVMGAISATNVAIHIGPGTFETHGNLAWQLKDGWSISGAGMYLTTLKQTLAVDNTPIQIGVIWGDAENCAVTDLTVDCNYPALVSNFLSTNKICIFGVGMRSDYLARVRCINSGGRYETFALHSFAAPTRPASIPQLCIIEDCRVESMNENVTALAVMCAPNGTTYATALCGTGVIRNSVVVGPKITTGYSGQSGGIAGFDQGVYENNTISGTSHGYFHDTYPQNNVVIKNNHISAQMPIVFNGNLANGYDGNVLVTKNVIVAGDVGTVLNTALNVIFDGNTWSSDTTLYFSPAGFFFAVEGGTLNPVDQVEIRHEKISAPAAADFWNGGFNINYLTPKCKVWDNRYADGSLIPWMPDNYLPP